MIKAVILALVLAAALGGCAGALPTFEAPHTCGGSSC